MTETIEAVENTGSTENENVGTVIGIPEQVQTPPVSPEPVEPTQEPAVEAKPELQEGQWLLKDGVFGPGDRPEFLLEKYGYNMETQAKAGPDAQKKIGELNQRLGAFTGAPDKYDFSSIEKDGFKFDDQDKTFNQFVTECQNNNVSQDFALKVASLAKEMIHVPQVNSQQEAQNYGASFDADKKNIVNWVKNNNSEPDSLELLESVKTAAGMRAMRNLMNTNGFHVPGNEVPTPPRETLKDVKADLAANLYEGENIVKNPEKAQKYIDKFKKIIT